MSDPNLNGGSTGENPWQPQQSNQAGSTPYGASQNSNQPGQAAQPGEYGQYSPNTADPNDGQMGQAGWDQNPPGYGNQANGYGGAGYAGYGQGGQYTVVDGEPQVDNSFSPQQVPQVPSRLAGVQGVSLGKRIGTRILDGILNGILTFLVCGLLGFAGLSGTMSNYSADELDGMSDQEVGQVMGPQMIKTFLAIAAGAFIIFILLQILNYFTGWTLGGLITGVRTIDYKTGKGGGWRAVAKQLIYYFLNGTGIAVIVFLIIWFASRDSAERHWLDRVLGTWVIDTRNGRDTHKELKEQGA